MERSSLLILSFGLVCFDKGLQSANQIQPVQWGGNFDEIRLSLKKGFLQSMYQTFQTFLNHVYSQLEDSQTCYSCWQKHTDKISEKI